MTALLFGDTCGYETGNESSQQAILHLSISEPVLWLQSEIIGKGYYCYTVHCHQGLQGSPPCIRGELYREGMRQDLYIRSLPKLHYMPEQNEVDGPAQFCIIFNGDSDRKSRRPITSLTNALSSQSCRPRHGMGPEYLVHTSLRAR